MTIARDPVTIENKLMEVVGALTREDANAITGREPNSSYFYAAANPDAREQLNVRDLELLDLEHHARFGTGFPLFEALGRRLSTARAERFADAAANLRAARDFAREAGEAVAALLDAAIVEGDAVKLKVALRECEEAHALSTRQIATLRQQLDRVRGRVDPG